MDGCTEAGGRLSWTEGEESATTDQALARRIAAGDVDAWDRFFDRYAPWAYRFASRHLGLRSYFLISANAEQSCDLCQSVFRFASPLSRMPPAIPSRCFSTSS